MKPHTRIYIDYFGYTTADFIPCEVCGAKAVDIHHIEPRGMGGDPTGAKDVISNLMSLCRTCHERYGDKKQHMDFLRITHQRKIESINR